MAQEYKVTSVENTGKQDQNGNDMFWVSFDGVQDNALMFAKKMPETGTLEYGELTNETGKTGKPYLRFRRKQKEDGQTFHSEVKSFKGEKEYTDHHEEIKAQWAIGQAVQWCIAHPSQVYDDIEGTAKEFYVMVDRVKGNDPKEQRGIEDNPATGYDVFKSAGGQVKSQALADDQPPTSAYDDVVVEEIDDSPIDLSEIPF